MDPIIMYYLHKKRVTKRKKRRWDVHPINATRYVDGAFRNLYGKLKEDGDKFFNNFRMSVTSFDELVMKFRNTVVARPDLLQGLAFSPEELLVITLRYLGSGCSYSDLHYTFRIGVTTASIIIPKTCHASWSSLCGDVFPTFSEEYWLQISKQFQTHAHFAHCLGAIDGKHIRIIKPEHSGSQFYNYKNFFSVVLLAVADSNYRFQYIDVGSFGKDSDTAIYENSPVFRLLEAGSLQIPKPNTITANDRPLPYVFVGDEAFSISTNMMRPHPGKYLNKTQRIFNYRLSVARRYVECAFGILSNKWRIFHRALNLQYANCITVIKTCCALHNYVRNRDGVQFQDTLEISGLHDSDEDTSTLIRGRKASYTYRDAFADFFCSPEGSVPWQDSKI